MQQVFGDFDDGGLRITLVALPNCSPAKPHHTPTPSFSVRPCPDRLITVLLPQYKNSRIFVQRWTLG
jgi:hypothetical protein